jgi:hypothetical protein
MSKELGFATESHAGKNYMMFYCRKTGETLMHRLITKEDEDK